jgi:hypothetical protein
MKWYRQRLLHRLSQTSYAKSTTDFDGSTHLPLDQKIPSMTLDIGIRDNLLIPLLHGALGLDYLHGHGFWLVA